MTRRAFLQAVTGSRLWRTIASAFVSIADTEWSLLFQHCWCRPPLPLQPG